MAAAKKKKRKSAKQEGFVRTSVVLDQNLIDEAKKLTGIKTKRALFDEALRVLVRSRKLQRYMEVHLTVPPDEELDKMRPEDYMDAKASKQ